ncbi:unnamed protein product [Pleuronectes platessa]|uniref:Immunoglobulin V-set domain-containing protein n=1 Tax=Pleuronectes platessa TaxID=8262 RepID=A0A9N7UXZ4_PLEPL|nr:unnamed protein product [Pleuronectes platessa]
MNGREDDPDPAAHHHDLLCLCRNFFCESETDPLSGRGGRQHHSGMAVPTRSDKSPNLLFIICNLITDLRVSIVYHLHEGVEVPESQDEQFSGRVQWDRDVLREEGRLRLHVSRLRTEDSGRYKCVERTGSDLSADQCWLNVTATVAQEQHTTPTVNPEPLRQERFYIALAID